MNRSYNIKFEIFLKEQDTSKEIGGSSKAIFITGGPGSGKDLYIRNLIEKYNLIEIPSSKFDGYFNGTSEPLVEEVIKKNLGVIVNSSGDSLKTLRDTKLFLEGNGYHSMMVFVHVDDNTSKIRNEGRKRMLSEDVRSEKWSSLNAMRKWYQMMFKDYTEIDNSSNTHQESSEVLDGIDNFLIEGVSINISGDTSEEVLSLLDKITTKNSPEPKPIDDPKAFLTLGKPMEVTGEKVDIQDVVLSESFQGKIKGILESIDCGIEPGLSMAGSGENLSRGADKKSNKSKSGLEIAEDKFGDEITNTITQEKEDELNKAGIKIPSVAVRGSI